MTTPKKTPAKKALAKKAVVKKMPAKKTAAEKANEKSADLVRFSTFDWSPVQLSADLELMHAEEWQEAVRNYEKDPRNFYNSYEFLVHHPANTRRFPDDPVADSPESWFMENLRVSVAKVDPKTKRVETKHNPHWKKDGRGKDPVDTARNTEVNIWLEWGPYKEASEFSMNGYVPPGGTSSHDPRLDTGAKTFEAAIVKLADKLYRLYGARARISDDKELPKKPSK